jgi:hypothetical protein
MMTQHNISRRALVALVTALTACGPSDDTQPATPPCIPVVLDVSTVVDGGTLEAGSCYLVNENLVVSGGTLVVEEGVVLQFNADVSTDIQGDGRLSVQGTEGAPVMFTGQEETNGFWRGVKLDSSGADNTLDHFIMEYAGSSPWTGGDQALASFYATANATGDLTNCEIRHGGGHAFEQVGGAAVTLTGCKITDNDDGGFVHPNNASLIAADNEFTNNATNVVRVSFGNNDSVEDEQTWNAIGVPWRVEVRTFVKAPLTLAEGVTLEFNADASMIVEGEGRLTAVGTEAAPITFTGAEKIRGYWKGIQITTTGAANKLDHAVFEYAGSEAWTGGADTESTLRMDDGSSLSITNTTFRESANYGIWATDNVVFDQFSANAFENNARVAVMHPNIVGQVAADNTFTGNDEDLFRVTFGNTDTVAQDQTWNALDIPYLITDRTFVDAALTVAAGTTIQFLQDASLVVDQTGSLTAVGTAAAPIVFTAVSGEETAGFWKGIEIGSASTANQMDNVAIRYAGAGTWYGGGDASGAIHVNNGTLSISNSEIADITGWGIDISSAQAMLSACDNVTFTNVTSSVKGDATACM